MTDDNATAPPTTPDPAEPAKPARRKKTGCRNVLIIALALITALVGWGYWLWASEPEYWVQRDNFLEAHTPDELLLMSEKVERRILSAFSEPPPTPTQPQTDPNPDDGLTPITSDPDAHGAILSLEVTPRPGTAPTARNPQHTSTTTRTDADTQPEPKLIHMSMNEVNAWMNQRLNGWLVNQGKSLPKEVKRPMLAAEGDKLVLAFRYESARVSQIISVKLDVDIRDNGQAVLSVIQVRGGRLPLPARSVGNQLAEHREKLQKEQASRIKKLTETLDGATLDAILPLGQEDFRLLDIKVDPTGIEMTMVPDQQADQYEPTTPTG